LNESILDNVLLLGGDGCRSNDTNDRVGGVVGLAIVRDRSLRRVDVRRTSDWVLRLEVVFLYLERRGLWVGLD
jgi:hypothetical protein